jgi:phage FluMu gp28-like protein
VIEENWIDKQLYVVYLEETKHKLTTDAVGRIQAMHAKFKFKKINLDETGLGAGPTDIVKEKLGTICEGITFTIQKKEDLYSNLKILMESGKLKIPNNKKLIYQLQDLRYELTSIGNVKIHHSERGHDDYPTALALAVYDFRPRKSSRPSLYIPTRK